MGPKGPINWLEAEGEVEGQMHRAIVSTQKRRKKKLNLWKTITCLLLFTCYVTVYVCGGCLNILSPAISEDLTTVTSSQITLLITMGTLARVIPKIVFGCAIDFLGGKKMLVIGCVGMIGSSLAFPLGHQLWWMGIAWCTVKIFGAITWPSIVKIISKWFLHTELGRVMSLLSISYLFGDSFALVYICLLSNWIGNWEVIFYSAGLNLFVMTVLVLLVLRGSPVAIGFTEVNADPLNRLGEAGNYSRATSFRELFAPMFTSAAFILLALYYSIIYMVRSLFFSYVIQFVEHQTGCTLPVAICGLILFNAFGAISAISLGVMVDKLPPFRCSLVVSAYLSMLSISLSIMAYLSSWQSTDLVWILVAMCACGFFLIGPFSLPAGVWSIKFGGKRACAATSGTLDGLGSLVSLLAVPAGEYALENDTWTLVWTLMTFAVLFSTIISVVHAFAERREVNQLQQHLEAEASSSQ